MGSLVTGQKLDRFLIRKRSLIILCNQNTFDVVKRRLDSVKYTTSKPTYTYNVLFVGLKPLYDIVFVSHSHILPSNDDIYAVSAQ